MQQGIRMCKTDEDIWVQYYQLELLYALKLRVRRQVLGLTDPTGRGLSRLALTHTGAEVNWCCMCLEWCGMGMHIEAIFL